jgi:hypothetical protein
LDQEVNGIFEASGRIASIAEDEAFRFGLVRLWYERFASDVDAVLRAELVNDVCLEFGGVEVFLDFFGSCEGNFMRLGNKSLTR